jgi:hypothetical protein
MLAVFPRFCSHQPKYSNHDAIGKMSVFHFWARILNFSERIDHLQTNTPETGPAIAPPLNDAQFLQMVLEAIEGNTVEVMNQNIQARHSSPDLAVSPGSFLCRPSWW